MFTSCFFPPLFTFFGHRIFAMFYNVDYLHSMDLIYVLALNDFSMQNTCRKHVNVDLKSTLVKMLQFMMYNSYSH